MNDPIDASVITGMQRISYHRTAMAAAFLSIYAAFFFCKIIVVANAASEHPYAWMVFANLAELFAWFFVSRRYFPECAARTGIIILYGALALYATAPAAILAFGLDIFPFPSDQVKGALIAQSIALTHVFLFFHVAIKPSDLARSAICIDAWIERHKPRPLGAVLVSLIGFALAALYYQNFVASGVSGMIGNASRIEITKTAETGKTWLLQYCFISWLMATCAVSTFRTHYRSPALSAAISLCAIALFLYVYLSIGNRRELAILLVFVFLLSTHFRKKYFKIAIVGAFPLLLIVGVLRALNGSTVDDNDTTANILNLFGEFVFPHYPLIYYSGSPTFELKLGSTFFLLPGYALPSFGLWNKANSLSVQFASEFANLNMGYALTPLAEGYINFGWLSVVLTPMLLSASLFLSLRLMRLAPLGLLILLAFPLDISRGEFTTIAFQWIIFSSVFHVVAKVARIEGRSHAASPTDNNK